MATRLNTCSVNKNRHRLIILEFDFSFSFLHLLFVFVFSFVIIARWSKIILAFFIIRFLLNYYYLSSRISHVYFLLTFLSFILRIIRKYRFIYKCFALFAIPFVNKINVRAREIHHSWEWLSSLFSYCWWWAFGILLVRCCCYFHLSVYILFRFFWFGLLIWCVCFHLKYFIGS